MHFDLLVVCLMRCKNLVGNYSVHLRHLKTKQCIHLHNPKKYSFLGHKWVPVWSEVFTLSSRSPDQM